MAQIHIVSYHFLAGSLKILTAPQKNGLLFFFSSRQKTAVTDMQLNIKHKWMP